MDLRLYPAPLRGAVTPPPSKSLLHRQLICLAQAGEFPCPPDPADDVLATVRGLWALYHQPEPVIDCGASGSTLAVSSAPGHGPGVGWGPGSPAPGGCWPGPCPGTGALRPRKTVCGSPAPFPRAASRWTEAGPPS